MNTVAITTSSFAVDNCSSLDLLKRGGISVVLNPYRRKLNKEETIKLCNGVVGIIAGMETLDAEVLMSLPGLKVISRCGTGTDNVDMETAKALGIKVFNTPGVSTLAVAELTVGLILSLLRKVTVMDRTVRSGLWRKRMGNLLAGKTVGIIGFGRIGKKTAVLLHHFGCNVQYCDTEPQEMEAAIRRVSMEKLLSTSDIISLHISGAARIIGAGEVGIIKKGAWLVNVARGGVVDEHALHDALVSGHLSGAALDVFEKEPYDGPLKELENVILTPHIGSYARETRIEMELTAVKNLLKGMGVSI